MSFTRKLIQAYFNYAYNLVYDFTTGRLNRYYKLQESCVSKLELKDKDRVLCVGVGTGNEIHHILQMNRNVHLVGIDCSSTALWKARNKALALGKEIKLLVMDAQALQFRAASFDKVLCIHVMDFVMEHDKATSEIIRVLKQGGQFIITYPSAEESPKLGFNLLKEGMQHDTSSGRHRIVIILESLARVIVGMLIYLPLLCRSKPKSYSRSELEAMISQLTAGDLLIDEDSIYQDLIVYGTKLAKGG